MSHRANPAPSGGVPSPKEHAAGPTRSTIRPWEEVYPALANDQQHTLMTLAQQQGFLLADQIPLLPVDPVRAKLNNLLDRSQPSLPLLPAPATTTLEVAQADAVQRAQQTPDLFAVAGPPGTGKKRIARELLLAALAQNERVLFLSTDSASLDAELTQLVELPNVRLTRLIGAHEQLALLAPAVRRWTAAEQERAIRDDLAAKAQAELTAAEQELLHIQTTAPQWGLLAEVLEQQGTWAKEYAELDARRATLTDDIERDATLASEPLPYFVQRLRGAATATDKKLAPLTSEANTLAQERTALDAQRATCRQERDELRAKADALQNCSRFSTGYWKAKFDTTLPARIVAAEATWTALEQADADLRTREEKNALARQQLDDEARAERTKLLADERQRRETALTIQAEELHQQRTTLTEREQTLCTTLGVAEHERTAAACQIAQQQSVQTLAQAGQRVEAAREWLRMIGPAGDTLVAQARAAINVVAGPTEVFSDPAIGSMVFDWLIVESAQHLSEPTFVAAARKAHRWLLVGAPPAEALHERSNRPQRSEFFSRLIAALHPHVWRDDGERLVCRLVPIPPGETRRLECEPVADSPDIELRVLNLPNSDPQLAEVAFPANADPATAREYLARELQEFTLEPKLRSGAWHEDEQQLTFRFRTATQPKLADLGQGLHEELDGLETTAVQFRTAEGWTRAQAEAWLSEQLAKRDNGRCVLLQRPIRACPGLAYWLNAAFGMAYAVPPVGESEPHVEFLAVPERERRTRDTSGRGPRIGGAGYEVDLSDARQRASLPADLVALLPTTEWVNLHEAQALLKYLEQQGSVAVTVTSPFTPQVIALRHLAQSSPRLRHVTFVDRHEAEHVECERLIISLTRSHMTRAVTFGESPAVMSKLLSRVRRHVLFVGDPGTLARRLQWDLAVDHLNLAEATKERRWIAALADCPRVNAHRPRPHAESVRA